MSSYFLLFKPYGYLSQFTRESPEHKTLGDLFPFPKDVYPVGRLDLDSEGLLLLTDDKKLNKRVLDPSSPHERTYWVQVEGIPDTGALEAWQKGIMIRVNGKNYQTLPAKARLLTEPPPLPERDPPVRFRKHIPTSWLELTLVEGKNRQVRRMCAKAGFPVLRLVRCRIGKLEITGMEPGEVRKLEQFP
ncbi:MAG: pseudouridine synthase [Saprospirales bacterium]|nr:pseudouridine synthase [Saprospirales bacterium]MBK8492131.1 pseudouridine synthase [Saprospirales bacterium]